MKNLILIRHGETETDKTKSDRQLTTRGQRQIDSLAKALQPHLSGNSVIGHSETLRARQTAELLASRLFINDIIALDLRLGNANNISNTIRNLEKKGIRPAEAYLFHIDYKKMSVESPLHLFERWQKLINQLEAYETIIFVSHEASLEGFLAAQDRYRVEYKSFDKYFEYADFAVLATVNNP